MGWLYLFLARLMMGERWRKATPGDKRFGAAAFFVIAVYFGVFALADHFGLDTFMDRAGPIKLWVAGVAVISLLVFGVFLWARHVPARLSAVLAVFAWAVLLFFVFYFEWLPVIHK